MQNSDKTIKIEDIQVSYIDIGPDDGTAILFVHGFPLNKTMWNEQVDVLKEWYRVIAYDVRGHGNSGAGTQEFSIELFTSDLINFIGELQVDKVILCGLSMGGYIALNAVKDYPERFEALILCDTQCIADTPEAKEKRMKAIESIKENGVGQYADESVKNLFASESFSTRKDEITAVKKMIRSTTENSLTSTLKALAGRKDTCGILPQIQVPVLILTGEKDKITPPSVAESMHEKIINSTLEIIGNAGHLSNMENPEEFNKYFMKFVSELHLKKD